MVVYFVTVVIVNLFNYNEHKMEYYCVGPFRY